MGVVRFDCYEFDGAAGQLRKRGSRLHLRDQPLEVLALLLEHPGEVVTREDLHRRLWPHDVIVDFENNLNTAISRLREALGDSAEHPRFIETLPRRGYRFIAGIEPAPATGRARLLVLPFVNSSGDSSQEYFSDGVTDEIITELSGLAPGSLGVIARTTAMRYKGTHKDVARIGRELSVDWIVEGSARHVEDRLALTVQLIRTSDQTHVFAQRYERALAEMFTLERTIARTVAGHTGAVAPGQSEVESRGIRSRTPTHDLVAYNLYVHGRQYLDRGPSPECWVQARQCLEAAIERDPGFALAHDALAELWWDTGVFGVTAPRESLAIGMPHAVRAVEIDGGLAEAHASLAQYLKQVDFNWAEVQREMALALELGPASPIVRKRHAQTFLMPFGRLDEAVHDLELAVDVDPLEVVTRMWLAVMLWLDRQYERAIDVSRLALELEPGHFLGHFTIGIVFREAGMFAEAIAAHRTAVELSGGSPFMLGWLGLALAEGGDRASARAVLDRLRAMPPGACVPPTSLAWIHLGLGEIDQFFQWMDRAIDARDHMITPIKSYPFMDRIRDDPRYIDLLRKMNLS